MLASAYQPTADVKGNRNTDVLYTTDALLVPLVTKRHQRARQCSGLSNSCSPNPHTLNPLLTSNRGRNVIWVEAPPKSRVPTVCWFWPDSCPANNIMLRAAPGAAERLKCGYCMYIQTVAKSSQYDSNTGGLSWASKTKTVEKR